MEGDGKVLIRSNVIKASGSSEAWYVPPRLFARCGLVGERSLLARLAESAKRALGHVGEKDSLFEHL